jgi:hypothetical protein
MAKTQSLLVRLLNTPDLARIVPRLQPEVLHRVIQTCGLEDCAEFVAMATPAQLTRLFDLDIWRVRDRSAGEEFDADRFGVWIAVLMQSGAAVAAEKLLGLDIDLVVAGLTRHAAVVEHAAIASYTTLDGEQVHKRPRRGLVSELGGYVLEARRTSSWEPIVDLLAFLDAEHPEYFHRVMSGCVELSSEPPEEDGFHDLLEDDEQHVFDLGFDRERRREQQGYVTPAQASAFLKGARTTALDGDRPPASPIARAYFRALEWAPPADADSAQEPGGASSDSSREIEADAIAGVVEILHDAGVLAPVPRAQLAETPNVGCPRPVDPAGGESSRLAALYAHADGHPASAEELAYLANTIVAGCSIQGRPLTPQEASDGAAATCNLGLEHWPAHWPDRDLVTAFQIGWAILHRDVCMYAAHELIDVLAGLRCPDRGIQLRLHGLRRELTRHAQDREPWRARHVLDAILMLDSRAWAVLAALIEEYPIMHSALHASQRAIDPSKIEFISQDSQLAEIRAFMAALPSLLTG